MIFNAVLASAADELSQTKEMPKPGIRVAFLGDIHIGSKCIELDSELHAILKDCDYVVANLESPICQHSPMSSSKILLQNKPGSEAFLAGLHVSSVVFANNHIFDHGLGGFEETCLALNSKNILYTGAGKNLEQATKPLILQSENYRVGIISCAEATTQAQIATSESAGCNHLHFPDIANQIKKLKSSVDAVIVTPHWGFCDYAYPPLAVVQRGEKLIAAGANMVIGHHSHVIQGIRKNDDNKFIVYSLGDFFFSEYYANGMLVTPFNESRKGLIVIVEFRIHENLQILPIFTISSSDSVRIDFSEERQLQLDVLSIPLKSLKAYSKHWRSIVRARFLKRLKHWIMPARWRAIRIATLHGAFIMLVQMVINRFRSGVNKIDDA